MTFRLLVCGSRNLTDYDLVRDTLDRLLANRLPDVVIIHGAAPGADSLAQRYADERRLAFIRYPADWKTHGRAAGPIRNQKMLDEGKPDAVVAFPSRSGRGTQDTIDRAHVAGLDVRVYWIDEVDQ